MSATKTTMSEISNYRNKLLGYIMCPSDYELIEGSISSKIPIYILEENIPPHETHFDGKAGDLVIGGGTGAAEALRISLPEAVSFLDSNESVFFESPHSFKSFWSHNFILRLANGFSKVGWNFNSSSLEIWLARQVIGWIKEKYPMYLDGSVEHADFKYKSELFTT